MRIKTKVLSALLSLLIILTLTPHAFAATSDSTDSISREKMIAMANEVLNCEDGFPDWFTFHFCFELMEIDLDLAEQLFQRVESSAKPIEYAYHPSEDTEISAQSDEPRRDGCYVRDGEDGGYFVYDEFDDDDFMEEEQPMPESDSSIEPYSTTITNPKNGPRTSCICKLIVKKNGVSDFFYGTGFFVGDRVIATAGHMVYNDSWGFLGPEGWASEVYVIQAYDPNSSLSEPYGRYAADPYNMVVGASWKTDAIPDNDWGVVVIGTKYKGSYSYLTKRQISDVTSYYNKNIFMYGYSNSKSAMECVQGITVKPNIDLFRGYRTLYYKNPFGGDAEGTYGMSGSPILDADGRVIGIFHGLTDETNSDPRYGAAVSFDKYLYQKLKSYE